MNATDVKESPARTFRSLPDAEDMPYGLVRITVWTPWPASEGNGSSGTCYRANGSEWRNERNTLDVLDAEGLYDWSFDGFSLDYFNRKYLLHEDQKAPPLVRLAMWCLERWAMDKNLISQVAGS